MTEIIELLRKHASENSDEKNEIYYTEKQKRVLETAAENPHASAKEIADIAEVHPSYIPYIAERVDEEVVDNLDRLDEYLSEKDEIPPDEESDSTEIMRSFGAGPSVDDRHTITDDKIEFTFTRKIPVEITIKFPSGKEMTQFIERSEDDTDIEILDSA